MSEALESALLTGGDNTGGDPAVSIGAVLRNAREGRQLTLADVAGRLKLGVRQVEALESGNWGSLPGNTFARGFVRNYARLLDIESEALLTRLDATLDKPLVNLDLPLSDNTAMPHSTLSGGRRDRSFVVLGLVLAVLAGVVYLLLPHDLSALRDKAQGFLDAAARRADNAPDAPGAAKKDGVPEQVFPPGQTPQQVMNPQAAAPASGAAAGLNLSFSGDSWVEVRDRDGKVLFSERRNVGGDQALDGAAPLSVTVGKASAVTLTWRGKPVDLAPHTKGEVARLTLE